MPTCSGCGQKIRFLQPAAGKKLPVDLRPSSLNGNVLVQQGVARILDSNRAADARDGGFDLFVIHRCPGNHRDRARERGLEEADREKRRRGVRAPLDRGRRAGAMTLEGFGEAAASVLPPATVAAQARDAAIARVSANAENAWRTEALNAVRRTCVRLGEFISDDVWETGQLVSTVEDRALGPILQRAARNGWCVKSDRVRPSVRSHMSGKPIWLSLIHEGEVHRARP